MNDTTPALRFRKRVAIPKVPDDDVPSPSIQAPRLTMTMPATTRTTREASPSQPTTLTVANPMLDEDDDEASVSVAVVETGARATSDGVERPASPSIVTGKASVRGHASRFEFTDEYMGVLRWIDKARYTSREQVAIFADRDLAAARRILDRLIRQGLVERKAFAGFPTGYFLTPAGKDVIDSDTRGVDPASGPRAIRHTLAVAWVMLGVLKGELAWGKYAAKALGRAVTLDDFLSETEVSRAVSQEKGRARERLERAAKQAGGKPFVKDWEAWDAVSALVASAHHEVESGDWARYVWAAWRESGQPHVPDLVLRLPRDPRSALPASLAFEIERSYKPESVARMIEAYDANLSGSDNARSASRFRSCLWVCGDDRVANLVSSLSRQDERHRVSTTRDAFGWKAAYLTRLEDEREQRAAQHEAARRRGAWHVTADKRVVACVCGTTCKARYGTFESQQAAVEFAGGAA